ncbi:heme ABC exporter, ATP-binding protein CcmA [Oceaniovalibus guishaninsula JLT2003]|uniref:Heme ABC exporter, ATP-binding protein CcmA n=1 Tax=Oceaniovalibus guishaninsula JLT2003 TaxID=1231392 RepID=K2I3U5_9RHOB|nr:heme ABC exporter ATP-binding protein CcmA [Oceaniovalibus guishaninsula]EKE43535.1 heme ABC exporter, ATP-binding protein CcmA [Oceaniovalibus guishaninsula JLT2003]
MALILRDIAVARGGVPVLEGVSARIETGQALILRGPNGIGKTSLLRAVAGLQPLLEGTVEPDTGQMAYGAHADGIKAQMSVAENLRFWAGLHGTSDIDAALTAFSLDGLAGRLAATLSAGQKRRVGLARLLVTGRPIWLLDEPTVSLDTASTALFGQAVDAHLRRGGTALIATHVGCGIDAPVLDLAPYKAKPRDLAGFGGNGGFA